MHVLAHINKRSLALSCLYLITLGILLIDTYKSGTTVSRILSFSSRQILAAVSVIFLFIRIRTKVVILTPLLKLNTYILFPIFLLTSVTLSIINYTTSVNFVYSLTQLQYSQLFLIALFSGFIGILRLPNTWFSIYYKRSIYLSTPLFIAAALVVYLWPFDVFQKLSHEGNLFENLQVIVLLVSCVWSLKIAQALRQKKLLVHSAAYLCIAGILFFIAGDEAAWGQQMLKFQTPEFFAVHNAQKETTMHNLYAVGTTMSLAYVLIGLYGACAWLIQKCVHPLQSNILSLYIPPWFTSGYFMVAFIYNTYIQTRNHTVGIWSEFIELLLYLGVLFFIFHVLLTSTKKSTIQTSI